MYSFLLNLHSGFRYVVLALLVIALLNAVLARISKKNYTETNRKLNLFAMISAHIQLLGGLILYFVSPWVKFNPMGETMKDPSLRYWTVEHLAMMIFAIALITIGHARAKKAIEAANKHRAISIFYGLALVIILVAITQSGRHL